MATAGTLLSHVYPRGTRLNERGVLELGGCDALELAREFGTPAYVLVEDDLRTRPRPSWKPGGPRGTKTSGLSMPPRHLLARRSCVSSRMRVSGVMWLLEGSFTWRWQPAFPLSGC